MPTPYLYDIYEKIFEEIKDNKEWVLCCPKCRSRGQTYEYSRFRWEDDELELIDKRIIRLCCQKCNSFTIDIGVMWQDIRSAATVNRLMETIDDLDEDIAITWVNEVKYTHPTYYRAQEHERKHSCVDLKKIFENLTISDIPPFGKIRLLLLGCNRCLEIKYLQESGFRWNIDFENSLAVDVSSEILTLAKQSYPRMKFCAKFIEDISTETLDLNNERLGDRTNGFFDICIAFKLFQSAQLQNVSNLRRSFAIIYNCLTTNGVLLISIPKATSIITVDRGVNLKKGVYKNREINERFSEENLERIVDELNSSGLFQDVTVYYGNESSVEYYITCKKGKKK